MSGHSSEHDPSLLLPSAANHYARLEDGSLFGGSIEVDESYFGGRRQGNPGRGAGGKVPVFGILQWGGRVYTPVNPNMKRKTLLPITEARIVPDSIVYRDVLLSYNALDTSAFSQFRINNLKSFVKGQTQINGIENFWNQAKRFLRKYNRIPRHHFNLPLKKCEWRFNASLPQAMLKELKAWLKEEIS
jgi:transposase